MKKFNIENYKEFNVVTKSGKKVKILHTTRENKNFPVVAIIENKQVQMYTSEGKFYIDKDSENDLQLKPKE